MAFVHHESNKCTKSELDLFSIGIGGYRGLQRELWHQPLWLQTPQLDSSRSVRGWWANPSKTSVSEISRGWWSEFHRRLSEAFLRHWKAFPGYRQSVDPKRLSPGIHLICIWFDPRSLPGRTFSAYKTRQPASRASFCSTTHQYSQPHHLRRISKRDWDRRKPKRSLRLHKLTWTPFSWRSLWERINIPDCHNNLYYAFVGVHIFVFFTV